MLQAVLLIVVGLIGAFAFGLAWLSRHQRSALFVFGAIGLASSALLGASCLGREDWLIWILAIFAILGSVGAIWGVAMAHLVSRSINSMLLRDFESGQPFALSGSARVARVGSLVLRHQVTELRDDGSFALTVLAMTSNTAEARTEFVLRKPVNQPGTTVEIGGFRVRLVDVAASGNKSSVYTATLEVIEKTT